VKPVLVEESLLASPHRRDVKQFGDHEYLRLKHRPVSDFPGHIRIVDLFSGVGSLTLGVWEAARRLGLGLRPIGVDIDPDAVAVYKRNFPNSEAIAQDATSLLDGKLGSAPSVNENRFISRLGRTTFLLSGSPCQGFCPLNNFTRGRDRRNRLYLRAARLIELIRPTNVLLENVPDVVNGKVDVVSITVSSLKRWNYSVDAGTVDLAELGLPQHRKRHIVAASLKKSVSIRDIVSRHKLSRLRNVRWAIEDLEGEYPYTPFTTPSKQSRENRARIRYLHRRRIFDLPNFMRPNCHRDGNHSYKSMYGRLNYDLPAQTITSGFVSPGQGRFVHPSRERTLTPHEAARLQFFPDFFDFSPVPNRTALAEMIGNAAPMNLSLVFASELLS
jgi:DNA (cytosine-5)-methyltransferase 1